MYGHATLSKGSLQKSHKILFDLFDLSTWTQKAGLLKHCITQPGSIHSKIYKALDTVSFVIFVTLLSIKAS